MAGGGVVGHISLRHRARPLSTQTRGPYSVHPCSCCWSRHPVGLKLPEGDTTHHPPPKRQFVVHPEFFADTLIRDATGVSLPTRLLATMSSRCLCLVPLSRLNLRRHRSKLFVAASIYDSPIWAPPTSRFAMTSPVSSGASLCDVAVRSPSVVANFFVSITVRQAEIFDVCVVLPVARRILSFVPILFVFNTRSPSSN